MNNKNKNVVTREGYENFKNELERLKSVERLNAAEAIRSASEQGDLSENAEYDAAKEAQALLEKRIFELEAFLKNCEIVEILDDGNITIGKTITLEKLSDKEIFKIKLVGNNEAEPFAMKMSVASPIGKEIIGKKIGDTVTIEAPNETISYKIKDVVLE